MKISNCVLDIQEVLSSNPNADFSWLKISFFFSTVINRVWISDAGIIKIEIDFYSYFRLVWTSDLSNNHNKSQGSEAIFYFNPPNGF